MDKKTLHNTNVQDLRQNVPDVALQGEPEAWELVSKASSDQQGWMKSTKRMKVEGGYLYQVTSEHQNHEGETIACAEALAFVPHLPEFKMLDSDPLLLSSLGGGVAPVSGKLNQLSSQRSVPPRVQAIMIIDSCERSKHGDNIYVQGHAPSENEVWEDFTSVTPSGGFSLNIDGDAPAADFFEEGAAYRVFFEKVEEK